jgi:hypothetical protein
MANDLVAGKVVLFPLEANTALTPVRVILGDFLGFPNQMAANQTGIQIEIFSNDPLNIPGAALRACSASTQPWWPNVAPGIRNEASIAMNPPPTGVVWHYQMAAFLQWVNQITWASEWSKYGVAGATPARPPSRRVT